MIRVETALRLKELGLSQELRPGDWFYSGLLMIPFPRDSEPQIDWRGPFLFGNQYPWEEQGQSPKLKLPSLEQILEEIEREGWVYAVEGRYRNGLCGCECWLPNPDDEHGTLAKVSATNEDVAEAAALALVKILERKVEDANQ